MNYTNKYNTSYYKYSKGNIPIISEDAEYTLDINEELYEVLNEKIFVYLTEEIYNSFPKEITENMDDFNLEDTIPDSEGNVNVTLEEILNKKIVFIKYKNINEAQVINNMRYNITSEEHYVLIKSINI